MNLNRHVGPTSGSLITIKVNDMPNERWHNNYKMEQMIQNKCSNTNNNINELPGYFNCLIKKLKQ